MLKPSSILVVTPDLEAAAPLIDAVFGTAPKDRYLPHTITGRARSSVNAPARALLALLSLDEEMQNELSWLTIAKKAAPVFAGTVAALDQAAANRTGDYAVFVEEKKSCSEAEITQQNVE